jgi:hypothetical protein
VGAHISPYASGSWTNHLPERDRKLLLHRRELDRWSSAVATRGVTCVPLSLYFKGSRVKAGSSGLGRSSTTSATRSGIGSLRGGSRMGRGGCYWIGSDFQIIQKTADISKLTTL